MRFGLRWKILVLAVAAPAVLGPAALWCVDHGVSRHARDTIDDRLRSATLVCERVLEARSKALAASARVIAQEPRFLSTLSLPAGIKDVHFKATVLGVARDFNQIAKADLFEVLDRQGRLIASVGDGTAGKSGRLELVAAAKGGQSASGVIRGERAAIYQAVVSPVSAAGNRVGYLILGARLDDAIAGEIKTLTGGEVSFLAGDALAGSSLPLGAARAALPEAIRSQFDLSPNSPPAIAEIEMAAETFLTLARPVPALNGSGRVLYVVQRSLAEETAFLSEIQAGLLRLGAAIILVVAVLGLLFSLEITRPTLALMRAAEEMERGNYHYPLDVGRKDEIGYLAARFSEMREQQHVYVNSLEEAARVKSEFLAVASHELRTPVSIIKAYAELLAGGSLGPVDRKQQRIFRVIDKQLAGIERIIDDATWISQIAGERSHLSREDCDVREVIEEAVGAAISDAKRRQHALEIEIEPGLGRVFLDGDRIIHAVAHLMRNAIRFTPDGG
ncbi:MAG TPA: histidine kinase dimerization/phospho-acceptor domain-containing protein, partial [Candidatus Udaeobacter sp.]|nr:histidine kinase dimerization/phospho-acceptor domain-containing protein [Candidatus Udaeobacter sp.]